MSLVCLLMLSLRDYQLSHLITTSFSLCLFFATVAAMPQIIVGIKFHVLKLQNASCMTRKLQNMLVWTLPYFGIKEKKQFQNTKEEKGN